MKSFIITIKDNELSENAAKKCIESSVKLENPFKIEVFDAVTPRLVEGLLNKYNLRWNYPWQGEEFDFSTGLKKSAYKTADPKKRIACALSHYRLWKWCSDNHEHCLVLEHDAIFLQRLDPVYILNSNFNVVGINNPIGNTRKAKLFNDMVQEQRSVPIVITPTIDDVSVPQGIAGNSAYIIHPTGARALLDLAHLHGLWPNDALMCKQLVKRLGVTTKYYTSTQGIESTTVN